MSRHKLVIPENRRTAVFYQRAGADINRLRAVKCLALAVLCMLFSLPVLAQSDLTLEPSNDLPTLEPLPDDVSAQPAQSKPKRVKVGSRLAEIETRFLNNQPLPEGVEVDQQRVLVSAIASSSVSALLAELTQIGLQDSAAFGKVVSGTLPILSISGAETLDSLQFIRLSTPFTRAGAASNQADQAMQSDLARLNLNVDGSGVSIGILSDSYDALGGEAADIASGDLPNNVNVLDDTAFGSLIDEGRAMAQLIHDIAPGADLLFHTAFNGPADFAQGILDLRSAGADVIVDDVGYLDQPFFQDGIIAQAVDQVVADGAVYFSSAGNSFNNSYESSYINSGFGTVNFVLTGTPFELVNLHDFDPGPNTSVTQIFQLAPGEVLQLVVQWDQPFVSSGGTGSQSDLDALLYDSSGAFITGGFNANFGGDAVEIFVYQNTSAASEQVQLLVGMFDDPNIGTGPVPGRLKWINFGSAAPHTFFTGSSTSFGHPNAQGAVGVGASRYDLTPPFGVSPPLIEFFSSHGGTDILFDITGALLASPVDRNKPDLVAPDGVDTTFFSSGDFDNTGFPNFFGTSAASPNAAAVAALQLECDPSLSPAQLRSNQVNSAIDMESSGYDVISGAGLIDALAAVGPSCATMPLTCNGLLVTVNLNLGETPGPNDDVVLGTPGDDDIRGRAGNDTICGMGGNDFLHGNSGDDWIDGGDGVDNIRGGQGNDVLFSGSGATVGVVSRVFGGNGIDTITGGPDADDLRGGRDEDIIIGGGGDDELNGNADDDELFGGTGNDILKGGAGENDELFGEGGNDSLDGGSGNNDSCAGGGQIGDTFSNCETI